MEESINVNKDSPCILPCDQVKQTQTKYETGENKDLNI